MAFQLGSIQALGVGGLGGAIMAIVLAWNPIYARGYDAAAKKAEVVIGAKQKEIDVKVTSLSQCQAANGNYHLAVNEQLKVIQADLRANLQRLSDAEQKNAAADRRMLDAATKSAENAKAAREAILNAVDQCVRAGVPAEFIGVLNGILPKS